MIRSILTAFAMTVALLAVAMGGAQAQNCTDSYNNVIACATPYPEGGFADAFEDSGGPSADVIPDPTPVPDTADAAADAADAPELAFTGAETGVLTLAGVALVASGAVALTVRRRL